MKEVKIVLSKELSRIFHDKKMIFSLFLLPVLLIVGMFALISFLAGMEQEEQQQYQAKVYVAGSPASFQQYIKTADNNSEIHFVEEYSDAEMKDGLKNATVDLLVVFGDNFENDVKNEKIPDVSIYYNPSENHSSDIYNTWAAGCMEGYRQMLQKERFGSLDKITMFTVNVKNDQAEVLDESKAMGKMLGQMLPYFITLMLFAGAMSLGIDTIAGEKERGTLASLLITPVKRTYIVLGKLISLMILSVISALAYVVSLVVAFPMLGEMGNMGESLSVFVSSFSPVQVIELVILMVGIVFLYVSLIGLISVFAKNTKEASTYVMPAYIIVIGVGMMTMYGGVSSGAWEYAIPLYNCSIALKAILMGELTGIQFALTAVSSFAAAGLITIFIGKMFNSERIMFDA